MNHPNLSHWTKIEERTKQSKNRHDAICPLYLLVAHWMVGYLVEACRNCPSLTFCLLARPPPSSSCHLQTSPSRASNFTLSPPPFQFTCKSQLASLINSIPSISSPSLQFSQLRCRHLRGNSDLPQTTRLVTNIMPKKGGKKKNKGGAKAPVAAAVDKVADTAKNVVLVLTSNAPAVQYLKNKVQVLKFCAGRVPLAACAPNCVCASLTPPPVIPRMIPRKRNSMATTRSILPLRRMMLPPT